MLLAGGFAAGLNPAYGLFNGLLAGKAL